MSNPNRWKITGTFTTTSPMHVGSGDVIEDARLFNEKNDATCDVQAVVKDCNGKPCIPGTALKGVLRAWAEKFFKDDPAINRIFGKKDMTDAEAGRAEFHTALQPKDTKYTETHPHVPYWNHASGTGILSHVKIDHSTGAAEDGKLFFEEFVPEGVTFNVTITGKMTEADVAFLLAVLEHGSKHTHPYQFGASGADGWGRVQWKQTTAFKIADISPTPPEIKPIQMLLKFTGPFLVNDTSRTHRDQDDGLPHFTPLKRVKGGVWLPTSSFRGALRGRAEFLANSLGWDKKLVEQIFGHTGAASRLTITEFEEVGESKLRHQDFVAIDRFTGGAADGAKFHANYADRPVLKTKLVLTQVSKEAENLFALALRDVCNGELTFGFGASKGYGEATGELCDDGKKWMEERIGTIPTIAATSAAPTTSSVLLHADILDVTANKNPSAMPTRQLRARPQKSVFAILSKDLQELNILGPVDVEYELQGEQPARVRLKGKEFVLPVAPPASGTPSARAPRLSTTHFAHPYYFVRMEDREKFTGELNDRNPATHARYEAEKYSGTIRVKLTTKTPLLLCGPPLDPDATHKTYPVLTDSNGEPLLASSSVRGMLRSAYEAITNSRFGVFPFKKTDTTGHARRLAYRRQAKVDVEPALIEEATDELVVIRVLTQLWLKSPAKLPRYELHSRSTDKGESRVALKYPDGRLPKSGDEVHVEVGGNGTVLKIREAKDQSLQSGWYAGYVLITGANINSKRCERVFVISDRDTTLKFEGDAAKRINALWSELIADYQDIHARDLEARANSIPPTSPDEYLGGVPGKTAWSRHVYLAAAKSLKQGMRIYIRKDAAGNISDLFPVSISRKLYDDAPLKLLPPKLRPATADDQLSPAERVFGWVPQEKPQTGKSAHKSLLRVGPVTCTHVGKDATTLTKTMTLAILGQPKPAQGRFYLGDKEGKAQPNRGTKEERGYLGDTIKKIGNRIRGPKLYPHHQHFQLAEVSHAAPGKQNRTIKGYISEEATFEFDLKLTNLTRIELGALVWLLSLDKGHFLRLGLGKPLGFGSMKAEIVSSCISNGTEWIKGLIQGEKPGTIDLSAITQEFTSTMCMANPEVLDAFRVSAKGFSDLKIHYPPAQTDQRVPGEEGGKHYEWFSENERGQRRSLPDLPGDPSLPNIPS